MTLDLQPQLPPPVQLLRPILDLDTLYVETAFCRRLRRVFEEAFFDRVWLAVMALSGAGKSTEIDEFRRRHPIVRRHDGTSEVPVILGTPASENHSTPKTLIRSLAESFGTVPKGSETWLRSWIAKQIKACKTSLIIIDDAHGCTPDELLALKKLTDEAKRDPDSVFVGLVFVMAADPGTKPLAEIINRPTQQWQQFRGRMHPTHPWQHLGVLSQAEVGQALAGYQDLLKERFPKLRLRRWRKRIHTHLCHSFFASDRSERVPMKNVRNVLDGILRRLVARGLDDIPDGALIDEVIADLKAAPDIKFVDDDPGATRYVTDDVQERAG